MVVAARSKAQAFLALGIVSKFAGCEWLYIVFACHSHGCIMDARGAKFPSSELTKGKATSLPNSRSLVGFPVLFLVGKYRTKERRQKKITHVPYSFKKPKSLGLSPFEAAALQGRGDSSFGRWCEIGDITIFCYFFWRDSWLLYRPGSSLSPFGSSGGTRSAVAKPPVGKYARKGLNNGERGRGRGRSDRRTRHSGPHHRPRVAPGTGPYPSDSWQG